MKPKEGQETLTTAARRQQTWIARYEPDLGIRLYSSSTDATRARRPTDLVLFLLAGATLGMVSLFAPDPTTADQELTRFIGDLPGLLGWFWEICYDLLIGWPLVLLIASLVARHRLFLLRDQVVAIGLALGFTSLVAGGWSEMIDGLTGSAPPAVYPGVRVALATALIATTGPHLGRPLRRLGRWVIWFGAILLSGLATLDLSFSGLDVDPIGIWGGFAMRWLKRHDYL